MTATARPLHGEPRLDPAPSRRPARPARSTAVPSREDFPAAAPVEDPPYPSPQPGSPSEAPAQLPSRAPRAPFVVLLLVLLGGGLLCLLLLNTALTERAFDVHALEAQSEQLAETEQALVLKVDQLSDPGALAAQAAALGMVPGPPPTLLPAGAPLPPGARVVAREPDTGALLVVVPPPPAAQPPAAQPPAGGQRAGDPAVPAGSGTGTGTGAGTAADAGTATDGGAEQVAAP